MPRDNYTTHGLFEIPFELWKKRNNQVNTKDYNLRGAFEAGYESDENGHLPTVDDRTLKFLKHKSHPTTFMEIDWYNSNDPSAVEFRKNYELNDKDVDYFQYVQKKMANGGYTNSNNMLNEFNTGGTHAQNAIGGIPFGLGPQGNPITVEEGETSFKTNNTGFVFSNRIPVNDQILKALKLPKSLKGKTMSDVSKHINETFNDREDGISNSTKQKMLDTLAQAQESIKLESQSGTSTQMSNGGFTNSASGYGAAFNMASNIGAGFLQDNSNGKEIVNGQQNGHVRNEMTNTWENSKDAVATAYPIAGIFRGVEKLGKSAGQSIGGNEGGDFMSGFLDPMSNKMDKDTTFMEKVGGIDPIFAGMLAMRKNKERREKQGKIDAYNESKVYADNYALGGFTSNGGGIDPNLMANMNYVIKMQNENPVMSAQRTLYDNGYKIDVDGKWGPASKKAQSDYAKSKNFTLTGDAPDNKLLGLNEQGLGNFKYVTNTTPLTPSNEIGLSEITSNSNINNASVNVINNEGAQTDKDKEFNREKFNHQMNQALRYSPILANLKNTNDLVKPSMKTPMLDESKAARRYMDEQGILRNADNAYNTAVNGLSEAGMSGGALRNSILAAQLNRTKGLNDAYINAKEYNNNVDNRADMIDADTKRYNLNERNRVDSIYDQDIAAYRSAKRAGIAQMGTDVGNIGLENQRTQAVEKINGYSIYGEYIKDNRTGNTYNSMEIDKIIDENREARSKASTEAEKRKIDAEIQRQTELKQALELSRANQQQPKK